MKKVTIVSLVLALVLSLSVSVSAFAEGDYTTYIVTAKHVRERSGPSTDYKIVGHHDTDERVEVASIEDGWAKLSNGNYMCADYLVEDDTEVKIREYSEKYDDIIITVIHEQYVRYFKHGEIIAEGDCVTGKDSTPTDLGLFKITQKRRDFDMKGNAYNHVDHFCAYNGGEGFHDAHWRSSFGSDVNYRKSGSHGCTNCPDDLAIAIYDNCKVGQTRVLVLP